jgi:hypothetical protein
MEFLPSVRIELCTPGFKYMFNQFSLPLEILAKLIVGIWIEHVLERKVKKIVR